MRLLLLLQFSPYMARVINQNEWNENLISYLRQNAPSKNLSAKYKGVRKSDVLKDSSGEKERIRHRKSISIKAGEEGLSYLEYSYILSYYGRLIHFPGTQHFKVAPEWKIYEHSVQGQRPGNSYDPEFFEGVVVNKEIIERARAELKIDKENCRQRNTSDFSVAATVNNKQSYEQKAPQTKSALPKFFKYVIDVVLNSRQ